MPRAATQRQRRTQAQRAHAERRKRIRETKRLIPKNPGYLPSMPSHTRVKKLLVGALSLAPGMNPYKKKEHLGDHSEKDSEFDVLKKHGVPKHGFKAAKTLSKQYKSEVNKKFNPPRRGALLDVRDDFTLSPSYMRRHYTVQNPFAGRRRGRGNKINTQKKRKKKRRSD